jgi:hypothetical protein
MSIPLAPFPRGNGVWKLLNFYNKKMHLKVGVLFPLPKGVRGIA